jgi:hypothetical protein
MVSTWKHKKYGKREYRGMYVTQLGERTFYLIGLYTKNIMKRAIVKKVHKVAFESHEAAKKLGWKKVK